MDYSVVGRGVLDRPDCLRWSSKAFVMGCMYVGYAECGAYACVSCRRTEQRYQQQQQQTTETKGKNCFETKQKTRGKFFSGLNTTRNKRWREIAFLFFSLDLTY